MSTQTSVSADDVLEVIAERDREEYPVITSGQIHDLGGWDVTERTIRNRLDGLRSTGAVQAIDAGATTAYMLPRERVVGEATPSGGDTKESTTTAGSPGEESPTSSDDPPVSETGESTDNRDVRTDGGKSSLEAWVNHAFFASAGVALFGGVAFAQTPSERWLRPVVKVSFYILAITLVLRGVNLDRRLGQWIDEVRDRVDEVGGPLTFLWHSFQVESMGPPNPETPVERVARMDIVAGGFLAIATVLAGGLWIAVETVGAWRLVEIISAYGALAWMGAIVLLFGLAVVLLWASILAGFAIATTRWWQERQTPVDTTRK